jgi:hypothetical protein
MREHKGCQPRCSLGQLRGSALDLGSGRVVPGNDTLRIVVQGESRLDDELGAGGLTGPVSVVDLACGVKEIGYATYDSSPKP